jgi:hypothetical protein
MGTIHYAAHLQQGFSYRRFAASATPSFYTEGRTNQRTNDSAIAVSQLAITEKAEKQSQPDRWFVGPKKHGM